MTKTIRPEQQEAWKPSEISLEHSFTYRLHLLHKLTDRKSQNVYFRETGLSLSDGRCLATIGSFEPLSVKDLAQRGNLTKGQASRAAQALVDLGLVSKQGRLEDSRGVVLTLTESGRQIWMKTMAVIQRRNQEIVGCLSGDDQAVLSTLLDRLVQHNS